MRICELLDRKTYSPQSIADHHGVGLCDIMSQLKKGIAVEIALDHLMELPDYYDRLEKMEQ